MIFFPFWVSFLTSIVELYTDGMFKGIYNGKQYHVSDLATVLSRAWSSGVDRIIVGLFITLHFHFPLVGIVFTKLVDK